MAIDSVGYGLLVYAQSAREKEIGSGMVKKSGFASNMEKIAVGFSLFSLLAVTSFCTVEAKNRIVHPETHIELLDGTAVLVLSLVSPNSLLLTPPQIECLCQLFSGWSSV